MVQNWNLTGPREMGSAGWDTGWKNTAALYLWESFCPWCHVEHSILQEHWVLAQAGADTEERQVDESITCLSNDLIMWAQPAKSCLSLCAPRGRSQQAWTRCADIRYRSASHGSFWMLHMRPFRTGRWHLCALLCIACLHTVSSLSHFQACPIWLCNFFNIRCPRESPELIGGTKGTEEFSKARSLISAAERLCCA